MTFKCDNSKWNYAWKLSPWSHREETSSRREEPLTPPQRHKLPPLTHQQHGFHLVNGKTKTLFRSTYLTSREKKYVGNSTPYQRLVCKCVGIIKKMFLHSSTWLSLYVLAISTLFLHTYTCALRRTNFCSTVVNFFLLRAHLQNKVYADV